MNMKQEFQRERRRILITSIAQTIAVGAVFLFLFTLLTGCSDPQWCEDAEQGSRRAELCAQSKDLHATYVAERTGMPDDVRREYRERYIEMSDSLAILIQRQYRIDKHNALVQSIKEADKAKDPLLIMENGTYHNSSLDTMYYENYPKGASHNTGGRDE